MQTENTGVWFQEQIKNLIEKGDKKEEGRIYMCLYVKLN